MQRPVSNNHLPQLRPQQSSTRPDAWAKSGQRPKSHLHPTAPKREKSDVADHTSSLSSVFSQNPRSINPLARADEAGSVYSKSLKDRIKEFGNPLRGPVVTEMFVHYFYFLIVLLVAFTSNLDKEIRLYMSVVYMNFSILTLEISRLIYAKRTNSVIPVYLSLPMFALLVIVSRSVHQIVMVLWYISFLLVCMQSGSQQLQNHFKIYTVAFMSVYLGVVLGVMQFFYKDNCTEVFCGAKLSTKISASEEVILVFACLMVVVSCMMLERFIRRNAVALLERENYMRQLYFANVDLKRQLRQDNPKKEFDLEAPLSKATQILKTVKDSEDIDEGIQKELELLIILLTSDQLYSPDLYQKPADSDVHGWLNDLLTPSNGKNKIVSNSDIITGSSGLRSSSVRPPGIIAEYDFQVEAVVSDAEQEYFKHLQTHSEIPSYDVLEIENLSNGRSLYYYSWYLFRKLNFFQKFKIKEEKFLHWVSTIESGYVRENPYHNHIHAADVTHAMHYYITRKKIWVYLTPEEQIASIIAPIIHDYAHPGVNNAFLVAVMDPLAIKYSDLSVLEHFHTATVFEMMQKDEFNFLENLTPDERKPIREMVISMVLATDMTFHFDWIGKFKTKMSGTGLNLDQRADRKLLLNMAIKCADVNNPSKPPEQSRRWTDLVMEEFFRQGDKEKARGLPVSMFMSRGQKDIPKCQLGFIDYIVFPLFESWQMYMGEDILGHLENITQNKAYWKSQFESTDQHSSLPPNTHVQNSVSSHASYLAGSARSSRENLSRGSDWSNSKQEDGKLIKQTSKNGERLANSPSNLSR